jgi:hypothetical protein
MKRIPMGAYYTPDAVARARAGAATVAEVGGTSGHAWEVYARACEAEVFVSPRVVRVSEAGLKFLRESC